MWTLKKPNKLVNITKKEADSDIGKELVVPGGGGHWGRGLRGTNYWV